jgi:hypothetical protein
MSQHSQQHGQGGKNHTSPIDQGQHGNPKPQGGQKPGGKDTSKS